TLSIPSCATPVPSYDPPPGATTPCGKPDRLVRGLPGQLGGSGDVAHPTCAVSTAREDRGRAAPPAPREERSDVKAWTQASLPRGQQGQSRQAAQRLRTTERPVPRLRDGAL